MTKKSTDSTRPLADKMRPTTFDDFVGQDEIVGEGTMLRRLIEQDELGSLIFWGPPGVGKTTLAHIIAGETGSVFVPLSAVSAGKKQLMQEISAAEARLIETGEKTILFIDEIHRWSKAQQDALLPYVERGVVTLIGATTENPSFEVNRALLSRARVIVLRFLSVDEIICVIERALERCGRNVTMEDDTKRLLSELSGGDARTALNALEIAIRSKKGTQVKIHHDDIKEALQRSHLVFDKGGEEFYNAISALHKSMRGSDADAALYWLARMLEGGADPLYVARRVVRFASEDIGMANGEALVQAVAAYQACHLIGMPECAVNIAQAVVYCTKSQKSNRMYLAYQAAARDARETSQLGVPLHLRNAPTDLMKDLGYGKNYKYNHDYTDDVEQTYFPDELGYRKYL